MAKRGIDVEIKAASVDECEIRHVAAGQALPGLVGTTSDGSDYGGPVYVYRGGRFQIVPVVPDLEPSPTAP